jgi:hypothetical protein
MQGKNKRSHTRSAGLGDTVAKITEATGIDKLVQWVAGEDCGCDERRDKLNKIFPYRKPNCLTEGEHEYLTEFFGRYKNFVTSEDQLKLIAIYNRVFNDTKKFSTCASCVRGMIEGLKTIHNEYAEAHDSTS